MGTTLNTQRKNTDQNNPLASLQQQVLAPVEFPVGLTNPNSTEGGPYVQFDCFKYERGFTQATRSNRLFTVRLPFPVQGVSFNNTANYNPFEALLGSQQRAGGFEQAGVQIRSGVESLAAKAVANDIANIVQIGSSVATIPISADQLMNQASTLTGLSFNPRLELAFNGVALRSYSFEYTVVPKNASESKAIQSIIQQMEESFYPDAEGDRVFLKYPDEYIVGFYQVNGKKITSVPLIPDCFLSSFSYGYNPLTGSRFFPDGSPTSYRIAFELSEANNLTRPDIKILRAQSREGLGG